jgi:hypothetical protein
MFPSLTHVRFENSDEIYRDERNLRWWGIWAEELSSRGIRLEGVHGSLLIKLKSQSSEECGQRH